MSILAQIRDRRSEILELASRHRVKNVKIFGSVVRGEESPNSDIDFLVECDKECSLFDLIALKQSLEGVLGRNVDIVTPTSVHWTLEKSIIGEAQEL
ncbi:nucleotidyltransferase family protein [Paradesulfitobacterium ferrireducens]|uniref:nucleotidyltransferase family protein n=1 Tax=Paradesulfitobacterium ferrireducens TaxID=2816476 RepID=UPI001A8FEE94|nr:nucleotidyltransferase family protein [Paradesulfitobacterium ferrireducens]